MMKLFIDFIQYIFFILSVDTVHLGAGLISPSQFIRQLCQMTKKVELLDIQSINIFKLIHLTSVPSVITGLGLKLQFYGLLSQSSTQFCLKELETERENVYSRTLRQMVIQSTAKHFF